MTSDHDPPDSREVPAFDPWEFWRPGNLMSHGDLFPDRAHAAFVWNDRGWEIDDLHCIERHCPCTDVRLVIAPAGIEEDDDHPFDAGDHFAGTFLVTLPSLDPVEEETEGDHLAGPDELKALWTDLCASRPNLGAELAARRAEMKTVRPPTAPPAVRRQKPGRNEPCPCGSGKKYKKCCGK